MANPGRARVQIASRINIEGLL